MSGFEKNVADALTENERAGGHDPAQSSVQPKYRKSRLVGPRFRLYLLTATALVLVLVISGMIANARRRAQTENRAQQRSSPARPSTIPSTIPSGQIVATDAQLRQILVEPASEATVTADREATGRVSFNEDHLTPVITPYAGRVLEIHASKGDSVSNGAPLLVIESPDLVTAQNDLSAARADQARARIARHAAEIAQQRATRLHEHEAVATKDLQTAEQDLARAQADEARADAAVTVSISRLGLFGKTPAEIEQLGANPTRPDRIDRRVTIKAPIAGTIVDRKIGPGQYVKPDAPDPLFLISDLSTVWVVADVFESDLAGLHIRVPVEIRVDAYPDRTFPAQVSFISPSVDPTTHTVRVRCLVNNGGRMLKPDMFARIRIHSALEEHVVVVPPAAVVSQGDTSVVFLEQGPGRFCRREVHVARQSDYQPNGPSPRPLAPTPMLVVRDGLRPGDRIVTRGALLLNELSKPES